ncbi:DUF4345 family protein [Euzebya sp.]|uniref:DUF4345 family protein n=1 Tax=Euzebya sp. TaxID=1971409 RepID=UPI0035131DC2
MDGDRVGQVAAAGFAGMGLLGLVRPQAIGDLMGLAITTPTGRNEVRAVYGGFGLAVAGALVRGDAGSRRDARRATGVAALGMAAGRVVDVLATRELRGPAAVALAVEAVLGLALIRN